jgi:hypothetical protein
MTQTRSLYAMAVAAGVALAALGGVTAAHARGDVTWSVGIGAPGVALGVTNGYPAYVAPAPVYVAPSPVYYAPPPPVVYAPRPVYYAPPPVVVAPAYGYGYGYYRHHRHGWRGWDR